MSAIGKIRQCARGPAALAAAPASPARRRRGRSPPRGNARRAVGAHGARSRPAKVTWSFAGAGTTSSRPTRGDRDAALEPVPLPASPRRATGRRARTRSTRRDLQVRLRAPHEHDGHRHRGGRGPGHPDGTPTPTPTATATATPTATAARSRLRRRWTTTRRRRRRRRPPTRPRRRSSSLKPGAQGRANVSFKLSESATVTLAVQARLGQLLRTVTLQARAGKRTFGPEREAQRPLPREIQARDAMAIARRSRRRADPQLVCPSITRSAPRADEWSRRDFMRNSMGSLALLCTVAASVARRRAVVTRPAATSGGVPVRSRSSAICR